MAIVSLVKKQFIRPYFAVRTWWPFWFYFLNRKGRRLLKSNPPVLNDLQKSILADLKRDGIATTSLRELFTDRDLLSELQAFAESLEENAATRTKKQFLQSYWDVKINVDLANPFLKLALNDKLVDLANAYMEMWTKLNYITLMKTVVMPESGPVQSQRWHRDPEEKRQCKVFVYLNDVDEDTGPFIYVPQSVRGKKYGRLFPQKPPEGNYPSEGVIEKLIPPSEIRYLTGKAGTVIFCDTTGLHKGGHSRAKSRLMFTVFYSAPTYSEQSRFNEVVSPSELAQQLSPQAMYAVELTIKYV